MVIGTAYSKPYRKNCYLFINGNKYTAFDFENAGSGSNTSNTYNGNGHSYKVSCSWSLYDFYCTLNVDGNNKGTGHVYAGDTQKMSQWMLSVNAGNCIDIDAQTGIG